MTASADHPVGDEDGDPSSPTPDPKPDAKPATMSDPDPKPGLFARIKRSLSSGPSDVATPAAEHIAVSNDTSLLGLSNLRSMRVDDVMVPKADILAVPVSMSQDNLVQTFRDSGITRLPVYAETLDTPLGFLHLKDFALKHGFNADAGQMQLKEMLRPLLYVPPSMPIGVLLAKMQADRRHMALVIDEYGGTDGLVTIEDLIEQVLGEIEDEHDVEEESYFTEEKPGCYLALAKTPLEDFAAATGLDLTADEDIDGEEIDTLGGLVFMLAGRVPARTEVVSHPAGVEFEIIDADLRRVKKLRAYVQHAASA